MPKIQSENKFLTSIKGYNSVLICQNLPICNLRTLLHNIDSHTEFKKIGKGMPKIERENQFLMSIKGRNSVLICQNLPICNPRTLLPNINSHSKFEENWLKKMLQAESDNDALMDGRTDRRTDGQTLERIFLNGWYNKIPRTF